VWYYFTMISATRVHYLASQALNGFETLDFQTAVECAKADLEAILLHVAENSLISGVRGVEIERDSKFCVSESNQSDLG